MPESESSERRARLAAVAGFLLFLILTGAVLLGVLHRAGKPFSGLFFSPKGYVGLKLVASPEVDLASNPIGPADRLVALNGELLPDARALAGRLEALGPGAAAHYSFERPDGSRYEIEAPVLRLPERTLWVGIVPIIAGGVAGVLAAFSLLLAQPRLQAAWAFYLGAWGAALQLAVLPFDTFLGFRLLPWSFLVGGVAFGGLLHVGLCFPQTRWPLTRFPVAGAAAIYGLATLPWLVVATRYGLPPAPVDTLARRFYAPAFMLLCLPLAANAAWTVMRGRDRRTRRRARLVMPVGLALASMAGFNLLWNRPDIPLELRVGVCVLGVGLLTGAFVYAAVKTNAFEVPARMRRGVVRALAVELGVLAYLVLHAGVHRWAGMGSAWATGVVAALLLAGVFLTVQPLRARLEAHLEDLLFPGQRRARQSTRELAARLARAREPSAVVEAVREAVEGGAGAREVRAFVAGEEGGLAELERPSGARRLAGETLRAALRLFEGRRSHDLGRPEDVDPALRSALELVAKHGFQLAVALPEGGVAGGLLLGPRADGSPGGRADMAFLDTIAAQSSVALESARAWQEVQQLQRQLADQNQYLRQELKEGQDFGEIVGESRGLRAALAQVERVAKTSATVLIVGETGTGKELIARAIHAASGRSEQLLVKLACAAVPETLFESELFGHERGAFTGADRSKKGRFEVAHRGSIFLDDVDALPLALQAKLLRAVQEGEIQRLGSSEIQVVDVRIIAATNKDLAAEVRAGRFREDLYYRLNVVPIELPPLRERSEDIPALVQHFIAQAAARHGRQVEGISWAALEEMQRYSWPGNVRELQNVVERAVVLSTDAMLRLPGPLMAETRGDEAPSPYEPDGVRTLDDIVRDFKVDLVRRTLASVGGNHRRAAERLGIHRPSLTRLIGKLGLRDPDSDRSDA